MHQLSETFKTFCQELDQALAKAQTGQLQTELEKLEAQMKAPDFWADSAHAQTIARQEAKLREQLEPWQKLRTGADEVGELLATGDSGLAGELNEQLEKLRADLTILQRSLMYAGPYDTHDVILRLHAGAGGTDAQDWASMLERMYVRWAERSGMKSSLIEETAGEEAGIKSATISIGGPYAYGKLRGEHGVHRLVRLSPFNADHLRQTSFALVEVLPQIDEPDEVTIDEKDLKIDVYRSGGRGGQSVNTTDSAVRVTHLPTGITVSIQNERSQLQNKETAMKVLRSKLAQLRLEQHREHISELKGPQHAAEWGNQIRNYVVHPYTLVKDARTNHEEHDAQAVLDGKLDDFIEAYATSGRDA